MRNIWLSQKDVMLLPMSGKAWDAVKAAADKATGAADLSNQDSDANVLCLAAALVYARTGETKYLDNVLASLTKIANGLPLGRALALGRELAAYVIAADLIDLPSISITMSPKFDAEIRRLLTAPTSGGPANLIACQKQRPNNWGMHATASIVAVYAYLGDKQGLDSAANIFKGWLGDRSAYAGFTYGELDWQADPSKPVGVNPAGATKNGHSIGGALPDDMRRGGAFAWPPKATGYPWEALQGATVAAQILSRQGYDAWNWCDKALLRAAKFLYSISWPATGDDGWQPWLINAAYGSTFPTSQTGATGKNMGFTSWTHATPVIVKPPVDPPPVDPPPADPCADCLARVAALEARNATLEAQMKSVTDLVNSWQGE